MRLHRQLKLGSFMAAVAIALLPLVSSGEVYLERSVDRVHEDAAGAVERQILVNGIPTVSRSWTAHEDFARFAAHTTGAVASEWPFRPQVQLSASRLTIVQMFASDGGLRARVLFAQPTAVRGRTSVWEAELAPEDLLEEAAAARRGEDPGRDHPFIGAPVAARRVNVVESVGPGYQYSAIYVTSIEPREAIASLIQHLEGQGAVQDWREDGDSGSSAALTYAGRHVDLQADRDSGTTVTHIVIQTDIPPNQSREHS